MEKQNQTEKNRTTVRSSKYRRYGRYRRIQKDIRKKRRVILLVIFILTLIATCGIWAKSNFDTNVYQSKAEFQQYADQQFQARQIFKMTDLTEVQYEYGSPISYAVNYDTCENERVTAFMEQQINSLKSGFAEAKTEEEAQREKEQGDKFGYKPLSHAQLISSNVFRSDNGVTSLVLMETDSSETDKDMKTVASSVYTYQFSDKTGHTMIPVQIFKENYREKCAQYFTDYFQRNYQKDDLAKGWQEQLTATEDHFNKFAITGSAVTFFFDEGTVLNKSHGVVSAGISPDEIESYLRKDVSQRYIDSTKPMVALTYDDGPGLEAEERILNCLEANNAVATFFYQGYRVSGHEDKIKRAYDMGCEVGNHTWNHPVLTKLTTEELAAQLTNTNNAIYAACGAYPTVFRPSYGITNDTVNSMSGLPVIMWGIDTLDWKSRNGQAVFDVIAADPNLDGKIILLHSIHDSTADATELVVPWLREQGYQMVTVTELIKYKTGADPVPGQVYR